jgi:parallel beta-helix repeat protein
MEVGRNSTVSIRDRGAELNATVRNNGGSGISVYQQGSVKIDDGMAITGNTDDGIYFSGNSECQIDNITIQNNLQWGVYASDGSSVNISNSTISGNTVGDVGLSFGARSTLNANFIGTAINCDQRQL